MTSITEERSERQRQAVVDFFEGPRELDRLSLLSDDCVWWNGMKHFPIAPGQEYFRGKDEIGRIILGRAPSPRLPSGRKPDRYDLTTIRFSEVLTIADGPHVFRQHRYHATTLQGRAYENVYGFLFRFTDAGLIDRIWEHWGTLTAYQELFQGPLVVHDPDEVLITTPAVRRRLDLSRPVDRSLIQSCMDIAVHAPNGSNQQPYRFLFADDPDQKLALAEVYRSAMQEFIDRPRTAAAEDNIDRSSAAARKVTESVFFLRDHLHEVPVLCIPLVAGRTDGNGPPEAASRTNTFWQASRWGSVIPTLWSFMLALRSRGLGSAWTTITLLKEREVAEILGIPYDKWMQAGLFPVAHTVGTDFRPTPRRPAEELMRWNSFT